MTDKQSQLDDDSPKEEGYTKHSLPQVTAQERGDEEKKYEVLDQNSASTRPTGEEDRTSVSSETSSENDSVYRSKVPRFNCPEHIIICLDLSPEMKSVSFQCKSGPDRTTFQLVQRSVEIFVKTKSRLNPKHQFSFMVLDDSASWYKHFTNDVDAICDTLSHLSPEDDENIQHEFQMSDLLEALKENITLPEVEDIALPPAYVLRLIIVYGRSYCMPQMSPDAKQLLSSLLASPYFFFDVLYVHELPSEMNLCKDIYDYFCDMDEEEEGYMLEVSRSTTRLFDHMAALLAHPLQRPKQRDTYYKLTLRQDEESIS